MYLKNPILYLNRFLAIYILLTTFTKVSVNGHYNKTKLNSYFCDLPCEKEHYICQHAPCFPRRSCGRTFMMLPMTDESRDIVVNWHNEYRNKIARGYLNDTEYNYIIATNMRVMEYSMEIEFIAQCFVNSCPSNLPYDECTATSEFESTGRNMFIKSYRKVKHHESSFPIEALESWVDVSGIISSPLIDSYSRSEVVARATQIMWADSYKVGCGRARFGRMSEKKYMIICQYGPMGNIPDQPVFKQGKPCSQCPAGLSCNKKFNGLCGEITDFRGDKWKAPFKIGKCSSLHDRHGYASLLIYITLILCNI